MASPFVPLAAPPSLLGYHRQLAPAAGVKVSPICLGAMGFGSEWKAALGDCDEEQSFKILDYFYSQGGNFLDTAGNYQYGESERIIGRWMKERGNRDEMVLATKYTTGWRTKEGRNIIQSNYGGMNIKSLRNSLEASLEKLQTSYIDVLYIHWWDNAASIPEVMNALNDVVAQGKVLYLGISDTPAWIVAKANEFAKAHNLRQFVVYQGLWNAYRREFERDVMPMARLDGMALAPWGVLGQGTFKTRAQREAQAGEERLQYRPPPAEQEKVVDKLEEVAKRHEVPMQSIALAYVWHKTTYVFPIVGGRKVEQLKDNIAALSIKLSREEMDEIDMATGEPFDLGWPNSLFMTNRSDVSGELTARNHFGNTLYWTGDEVPLPQPIQGGLHSEDSK